MESKGDIMNIKVTDISREVFKRYGDNQIFGSNAYEYDIDFVMELKGMTVDCYTTIMSEDDLNFKDAENLIAEKFKEN